MNEKLVLITVTGSDGPGITAGLMHSIAKNQGIIRDMGQSIIHGHLSWSILIQNTKGDEIEDSELVKDLLFTAKKLRMQLDYQIVEATTLDNGKGEKYILSCVNLKGITAVFLKDIASTLAQNNINIQRIDNITGHEFKALEIAAIASSQNLDWNKIKQELMNISNAHQTDMALLKDNIWRRNKRLIVFDMDSTLIQSEVIDEMARVHGVLDKVHKITELAMNGQYDFTQSLIERVKLLQGMEEVKLQTILKELKLTEGVSDFIKTVKSLGYKVAIISGGFQYFAKYFKEQLKLDFAFANDLEIVEGKLTGHVRGSIIDASKKAMILEMLAEQENINLEQVVAIGDGANDLQMLAKAGLGIAFHAKQIVKENAKQHMSHGPMTTILYFLGIPGTRIE